MTEPNALDAAQAEADQDAADFITLPLKDIEVRVLPVQDWPSSAMRALNGGDFDTWAEKCLVDDDAGDDYQKWSDLDPTIGQVEEFFLAWEEQSGQNRGKSPAAARSSRRTRRR